MTDYDTLYIRSFTGMTGSTLNSGITSGITNIYQFIDDSGNVNQIPKIIKQRYKYYIDPDTPALIIAEPCVIGVDDEESGPCSFGVALGLGDDTMGMAKYV